MQYTKSMYLGIDIGGTKTLVALLSNKGVITAHKKFLTSHNYDDFLKELKNTIQELNATNLKAIGIAIPGSVDRERGIAIAFGNLPWQNVHIQADIERFMHTPVVIENDGKLAALSEAMLLKDKYRSVLCITIGTGIGTGVVVDGRIDPLLRDMEAGLMPLEYRGKIVKWESFASGHAIFEQYGKKATDITDESAWETIGQHLSLGLNTMIAIIQPDVVVIGGGVSAAFPKFKKHLLAALRKYETPLTPVPPIIQAQRAEEAVVYGCYDLAKERYGNIT